MLRKYSPNIHNKSYILIKLNDHKSINLSLHFYVYEIVILVLMEDSILTDIVRMRSNVFKKQYNV